MSSPIKATLKRTESGLVAFLAVKGHYSLIPTSFGKLYGWIFEKGYKPFGPAITVYYNIPGEVPVNELRWELRSRIAGEIAPNGPDENGLGVKRVESIQVASTLHIGPYEKLEGTYRSLMEWVDKNGYLTVGPPEELYFNDPGKTPPEELRTEIQFPVKKK